MTMATITEPLESQGQRGFEAFGVPGEIRVQRVFQAYDSRQE